MLCRRDPSCLNTSLLDTSAVRARVATRYTHQPKGPGHTFPNHPAYSAQRMAQRKHGTARQSNVLLTAQGGRMFWESLSRPLRRVLTYSAL